MRDIEIIGFVSRQTGAIAWAGRLPNATPADMRWLSAATAHAIVIAGQRTANDLFPMPDDGGRLFVPWGGMTPPEDVIGIARRRALDLGRGVPRITVIGGIRTFVAFAPLASEIRLRMIDDPERGVATAEELFLAAKEIGA